MNNQVIPEAAVEAAGQALRHAFDWGVTDFDKQARAALEAAAPHMRQTFFLEMNFRAVEKELNTPWR